MKKNRLHLASVALGLAALSCAFGSAPARAGMFSISPQKEQRLGEDAAKSVEAQGRVVTGPVADWVERVGSRLARASNKEFPYSFRVIDSPEINAFALPAGYVYVFTGLSKIARNDDELAAVLAHEITHAEQHHFAKQYSKASKRGALLSIVSLAAGLPNIAQNVLGLVDFAMTQKYSRGSEDQADHLGMERMVRAGFNPQGMVSLLQRLDREDGEQKRVDKWFASHPDGSIRVRHAQEELAALRAGGKVAAPLAPELTAQDGAQARDEASAQGTGRLK